MNPNPYLPGGTVYGTLLNFRREHALWAPRMHEAPYKAPPAAPVLYIKTANTFTRSGQAIALPRGVAEVEVAASLGLVAGEGGRVAGAVLFNDVAIPHESYYRPPVKFRCVDGFLGVGREVVIQLRDQLVRVNELTGTVVNALGNLGDAEHIGADAAQRFSQHHIRTAVYQAKRLECTGISRHGTANKIVTYFGNFNAQCFARGVFAHGIHVLQIGNGKPDGLLIVLHVCTVSVSLICVLF